MAKGTGATKTTIAEPTNQREPRKVIQQMTDNTNTKNNSATKSCANFAT
jgi:hypothetical protein